MIKPHLAPACEGGGLLFLSGQLGLENGALVGDDIATQTRQALANVDAILSLSGLTRTDVVKATVWLVEPADFIIFDQIYSEYFGSHLPARSTVVAPLVLRAARIEIEVIARMA